MAIETYKIRCKVTLQSYKEGKAVDITRDIRTLRVNKNLYQPAGNFEIELLPGIDKETKASWYYRTTPMDYIEIRFTRDWDTLEIPVVMRGFVDDVSMAITVDNNGSPNRIYRISGRDMGKIFDITRIYYLREVSKDLQLITLPGFKQLEQKYGLKISGKPNEIVESLFHIATNQLALIRKTQSAVPEIKCLTSPTIKGAVNQFALSQEDGSVWDLMTYFDNSPWNELFTVDLADAFYLVFRETPWKDYDTGQFIQPPDADIDHKTLGKPVSVKPNSILRLNLHRGDAEVKNYYFTYPVQNLIQGKTPFKALELGKVEKEEDLKSNPYLVDHEDKDAGSHRFGFRRFENTCEVFDLNQAAVSQEMARDLNLMLQRAFKYNSAYESGHFTLKGNSALRPGIYMTFDYRNQVTPEYYVTGIGHDLCFINNQEQFNTTVQVERGDGYLRTRDILYNPDGTIRKAHK